MDKDLRKGFGISEAEMESLRTELLE